MANWLQNLRKNFSSSSSNSSETATPAASIPLSSLTTILKDGLVELTFQAATRKREKSSLRGLNLKDVVQSEATARGIPMSSVTSYLVVINGETQVVNDPTNFIFTDDVLNGLEGIHANPAAAELG